MHLADIKKSILKQVMIFFITCLLGLPTLKGSCCNDTIKYHWNFALGIRIFINDDAVGPKIASNLGVELRPLKKQHEFFIRNYFNIIPMVSDTASYNGMPVLRSPIRYMTITNVLGLNWYSKNNKFKFGLGLYYERHQTSADKILFIISGHSVGLEYGICARFKGVNISLKHQFQLIGQTDAASKYVKMVDALQARRFSLCLEIPLKIR